MGRVNYRLGLLERTEFGPKGKDFSSSECMIRCQGERMSRREEGNLSAIPHAPCRYQQNKLEAEETNCLVCSLHSCGLNLLTASFIINEVYRSLVKKSALYNLKRTTCQ